MGSPTDLFEVYSAYGILGLCLLGIVHTRRIVDDSHETRPDGNGLGFLNSPHDVFIVVRGRDDEIFEASFAQIVIGAGCALISSAFKVILVTSITSNANVSNGGRFLPGPFIRRRGV